MPNDSFIHHTFLRKMYLEKKKKINEFAFRKPHI